MRVLTQFENGLVSGGCDVCGGKKELDPTPIVMGAVGGLVMGAGVAAVGMSAGYICAGLVLGSVVGMVASPLLTSLQT